MENTSSSLYDKDEVWLLGSPLTQLSPEDYQDGYIPDNIAIQSKTWIVSLLGNSDQLAAVVRLPRYLTYDAHRHEGVERLEIVADLPAGRYEVAFTYLHQTRRVLGRFADPLCQRWAAQVDDRSFTCHVRVNAVSPFIFAPRVQMNRTAAEVELDGQPWHYFDEDHVMLHRQPGTYRLKITFGEPTAPHILRTQAVVVKTEFHDGTFTFTSALPQWQVELPPSQPPTAVLAHGGYRIESIDRGNVVRSENGRSILSFSPGPVAVTLRKDG